VGRKLLTPVTSCDDDVIDTSVNHGIFDEIDDWPAEHFDHWFWSSQGKRA
jgi:hypothetical protein